MADWGTSDPLTEGLATKKQIMMFSSHDRTSNYVVVYIYIEHYQAAQTLGGERSITSQAKEMKSEEERKHTFHLPRMVHSTQVLAPSDH